MYTVYTYKCSWFWPTLHMTWLYQVPAVVNDEHVHMTDLLYQVPAVVGDEHVHISVLKRLRDTLQHSVAG